MNEPNGGKQFKQSPARKPLKYTVVEEFTHPQSTTVVRVTKSDGFIARFSRMIGTRAPGTPNDEDRLRPFQNVDVVEVNAVNFLKNPNENKILFDLLEESSAYILEATQRDTDVRMAEKIRKEEKSANRGKQVQPPGLKKLGKHDAQRYNKMNSQPAPAAPVEYVHPQMVRRADGTDV